MQVLNWDDSVDPATKGPICLSPLECVCQWEDEPLPLTAHNLTQVKLIDAILSKSRIVTRAELMAKDLKHIKAIAKKLKIQLTKNVDWKVEELSKNAMIAKMMKDAPGLATLLGGCIGEKRQRTSLTWWQVS